MITICAWCKEVLSATGPPGDNELSHGICGDCAEMLKKKYYMSAVLNWDDVLTIKRLMNK